MADETVAPAPASQDALNAMSGEERANWRLTGELPGDARSLDEDRHGHSSGDFKPSDVSADSSTAQPDAQAASTDATPPAASEPATPKKANAETRKAELNAEIQALLRQRDELKASLSPALRPTAPPDVPAASSPASQPVSLESVIDAPDVTAPILREDAFYAQFPDATVADYMRYAASYQAERVAYRQVQTQTLRQREAVYAERAGKVSPEVAQKLPVEMLSAKPVDLMGPNETPGLWNYAVQEILDSPVSDRLLAHLVDHPELVRQIGETKNQAHTIRTIAQIEARLDAAPVPPQPVVKTTTSAPPPPPTLGRKPAIPSDEVDEALASGDVAKYIRVMNQREMAGQL